MTVDGPRRLFEMQGSQSPAPLGLLIGSMPGSPSLLFSCFSWLFPWGIWEDQKQGGGFPSHEHLPENLLGADVCFVAPAGLAGREGGDPEIVGNLQGRGLLQQAAET